jgi:Fe-S cluster biogenesis protein NfuA
MKHKVLMWYPSLSYDCEVVSVLKDEVEKALDEVRPQIKVHGGDVELVEVKDGVVTVKLTGACVGCPMSQMTLQYGIGRYLKKKIPKIRKVKAI